jgi:hypothetical protein
MSLFIKRRHPFTGEINERLLPITMEELMRWETGELVQNVWPNLSEDDREFIKTGIFDWENHFIPQPPQEKSSFIKSLEFKPSEDLNLLVQSEGAPIKAEKVWTPPSKKVYQTKRFAAHKLKSLWPVFPYLNSNTILAGGSLRTILNCAAEKVSDFDLFFKSFEGVTTLREKLLAAGWENIFSCPEEKLFTYKKGRHKLQLICESEYSSPAQLIKSFDITACVAALHEGEIFFTREFVRSVFKKQARIQNVTFPVATIKRIVKYNNKGYLVSRAAEDFAQLSNGIIFDSDGMRAYIDQHEKLRHHNLHHQKFLGR